MVCSHCQGAEDVFGKGFAKRDLKEYREKGASKATQIMLDALKKLGVSGKTLLDIGGGVGIVQHELIKAGVSQATDVDASQAYIQAAQKEAERQGHPDKISFQHGDFVQLAPQIEAADIVTLDRVVCCYPDMHKLVELSSARAKDFYALIYPRDNIISRNVVHIFNFFAFRIHGNPFRTYIHDSQTVDGIIRGNGLQQVAYQKSGMWQVAVYRKGKK